MAKLVYATELAMKAREVSLEELFEGMLGNRRPNMLTGTVSSMNLARYRVHRLLTEAQESQLSKARDALIRRVVGRKARIVFMNATELGGGVAEMRPDSLSLVRDLGFDADWVIMDGCDLFYKCTVNVHNGMQDPNFPPLVQKEIETIQMVNVSNLLRLERDRHFDGTDYIWVDDPQPASMVPLIRATWPNAIVVWRCHVHADPSPTVGEFIREMVQGQLRPDRDYILLDFLKSRGVTDLSPAALSAHRAVFHVPEFAEGLGLTTVPVSITGPAVNPLAYKNFSLDHEVVLATLRKLGIMEAKQTEIPPYLLEVSRFDPYKGPIEFVAAFVEMLLRVGAKSQKEMRLVFAAASAGDNPTGIKLHKATIAFLESLPVSEFPETMRDIKDRVHLLMLPNETFEELFINQILKHPDARADRAKAIRAEVLEMVGQSPKLMMTSLRDVGLVSEAMLEKYADAPPNPDAVVFSDEQWTATANCFRTSKRTQQTQTRAARRQLTGNEMNAIEVNSLQSGARIRVQFSSKEGFGLVVSEAMMKDAVKYPAPTIATLVGGIRPQVTNPGGPEVGIAVPYEKEDQVTSLAMYNALPDDMSWTTESMCELFGEVRKRKTVVAMAEAMASAHAMEKEKRESMAKAAGAHVIGNFSTQQNVANILGVFCAGAKV